MKEDKSKKQSFDVSYLINFVPKWLLSLLGSLLLVFLVFKFVGIDLSVVGNRFIESAITEDVSVESDQLSIFTEVYPPYSYLDGLDFKGISIDLLKAMFDEMNVEFEVKRIQFLDWAAAYEITKFTNNTLLFTVARTESRENLFKWVGPIASDSYVLIGKKSSNIKIDNINDIRHYKIGALAKSAEIEILKERGVSEYHIESSTLPHTDIDKLSNDRIDLVAISESAGFAMIASRGHNIDDYQSVYTLDIVGRYFAFNKAVSDERVKEFQTALNNLRASGKYEKILKRYNK